MVKMVKLVAGLLSDYRDMSHFISVCSVYRVDAFLQVVADPAMHY